MLTDSVDLLVHAVLDRGYSIVNTNMIMVYEGARGR
jgi:hypothetical protein